MRIFISHAPEDDWLASKLADELAQAGFAVWEPAKEIEPGANWAREVGRALDESDVMIALVTRDSLKSESLRADIQYGLTSKQFERRVIPVLIDYVTFEPGKDVPWILLKMNPVYFGKRTESVSFAEVISRVRSIAQQETNAPC